MRQNVRLQDLCATSNRAWYVELEPESSPFVAFVMRLETINEPLFIKVEEAKRFLLLIARCGFSSQRCKEVRLRRATPAWTCAVRGALGLSVLSDALISEQVRLMMPRRVV